MRKFLVALVTVAALFSGCASNGMAVNTPGGNNIDRVFIEGSVQKQTKVIINDSETAILTGVAAGAGVGVAGGAIAGGNTSSTVKGGLIGSVVGGVAGGLIGKEVEAYQTIITGDDGMTYQGYLTERLNPGTRVEFTIKDNKLKNVNVLANQNTRQTIKRYN